MSVDPIITLNIVKDELEDCQQDISRCGWEISGIDEQNQIFSVKMKSPLDGEIYIIEIKFDNYKEWPLFIEFIDPNTGEKGTKRAYPGDGGRFGSFFHSYPCICNPCSRKAYREGVHAEWAFVGWQQKQEVTTLINIRAILWAIYSRISDPEIYKGRMNG